MDPLTQGALGAAWAQPAAHRSKLLPASAIGCIAGMAPDLDLLIRSPEDPLLALEFHRHFTHSLFFVPFGALLVAAILYPFFRCRLSAAQCYGFAVLGFASHGLLDACTSYGTQLLWPVSGERIAWNLISVVDPLFTLPLIASICLAVARARPLFALAGICWGLFYLGVGALQSDRVEAAIQVLAMERGHMPERILRHPSLGNLALWRTIYAYDGQFYIDAARAGFKSRVFEGVELPVLDVARDFPWLGADSQQFTDIDRFRRFADGFVAVAPRAPGLIIDLRYALVPDSVGGFWGIRPDAAAGPDEHVSYVTMRLRSINEGAELLRMLFR